jgi:hypothetical protein
LNNWKCAELNRISAVNSEKYTKSKSLWAESGKTRKSAEKIPLSHRPHSIAQGACRERELSDRRGHIALTNMFPEIIEVNPRKRRAGSVALIAHVVQRQRHSSPRESKFDLKNC